MDTVKTTILINPTYPSDFYRFLTLLKYFTKQKDIQKYFFCFLCQDQRWFKLLQGSILLLTHNGGL